MEQAACHLLATELAPKNLGVFFRVGHFGDDVQVANGETISGPRQNRREPEADAVGGSTLEDANQACWNGASMDGTCL